MLSSVVICSFLVGNVISARLLEIFRSAIPYRYFDRIYTGYLFCRVFACLYGLYRLFCLDADKAVNSVSFHVERRWKSIFIQPKINEDTGVLRGYVDTSECVQIELYSLLHDEAFSPCLEKARLCVKSVNREENE